MDPQFPDAPGSRTTAPGQNRLSREKSPYLLQHADNPVDWYPWGDEAFARAAREDKPVFLSIGYSTCHWCHVMAHESFEDPVVAELLNRSFIAVKVDREERPDIDAAYMAVCQMLTGQGGWPLTIVMTPEKEPFFAATYLPRERRFALQGLLDLLPRIAAAWRDQRPGILRSSRQIAEALRTPRQETDGPSPDIVLFDDGYEELRFRFDAENGGFGTAPKFQAPHTLLFLLRYSTEHPESQAPGMVTATLDAMMNGGIRDHLGGGFHRYATDARWRVPHFEKMLYDQALHLMAYTAAWQVTGEERYREIAGEIIAYVCRDLLLPEGAFAAAEDADSPDGEGAWYLWTTGEAAAVLGDEDAEIAGRAYGLLSGGTSVSGGPGGPGNVLYRPLPLDRLARDMGMDEPALRDRVASIRERLYAARNLRPRPARDDKILADSNGLMIAALAQAGRALGRTDATRAAERAMAFIQESMRTTTGRLLHRYRDGEAAIPAFADDYAFFILALLELYETTFEARYLADAIAAEELFEAHFLDGVNGGFYSTADDGEILFGRTKTCYDGAVPSANAVALENLLRLFRITGNPACERHADRLARVFLDRVREQPAACCGLLAALDRVLNPSQEIVITGDPASEDTRALVAAIRSRYLPRGTLLLRPASGPDARALDALAPFTRGLIMRDGKATAYLCTGTHCSAPVTTVEDLIGRLEPQKKG